VVIAKYCNLKAATCRFGLYTKPTYTYKSNNFVRPSVTRPLVRQGYAPDLAGELIAFPDAILLSFFGIL